MRPNVSNLVQENLAECAAFPPSLGARPALRFPVPTGMLASIGKEDGEMWLGNSPELKRPRYLRSLGAAVALLMGQNPGWQRERECHVMICVGIAKTENTLSPPCPKRPLGN